MEIPCHVAIVAIIFLLVDLGTAFAGGENHQQPSQKNDDLALCLQSKNPGLRALAKLTEQQRKKEKIKQLRQKENILSDDDDEEPKPLFQEK